MSECEKSILQHGVTKEGPIQKRWEETQKSVKRSDIHITGISEGGRGNELDRNNAWQNNFQEFSKSDERP